MTMESRIDTTPGPWPPGLGLQRTERPGRRCILHPRPSTPWPSRPPSTRSSRTSRRSSRARPTSSASPWSRSCARATSSSRTCPAPASRCWPGPSPSRSTPRPTASSARPTCSRATSPARRSSTRSRARSSSGPARSSPTSSSSDEINRATPKTQSALLEAMAERRVSADGVTYDLPRPVPRARHAEPDRAGRHVPAPRGPARPLPVQAVDGLHGPRRRVRGHVRQLGPAVDRGPRRGHRHPTWSGP